MTPSRLILLVLALLAHTAWAQPQSPVTVSATPMRTEVRPGDQLPIAITFEIEEPWHIWPNKPEVPPELDGFTPVPTALQLQSGAPAPSGITIAFDHTQWPAPKSILTGAVSATPIRIKSYGGMFTAFIPVLIDPDAAPGPRELKLLATFQSCDDKVCLAPDEATLSITLNVLAPDAAPAPPPSPDIAARFQAFDASVFATIASTSATAPANPSPAPGSTAAPAPSKTARVEAFGVGFDINTSGAFGIIGVLLAAAVAGAILNLTPCVLPVIPLKITSLSKSAGDRRRTLILGLIMSAGVIGFWAFVGFAITGLKIIGSANEIFAYPWVVLGIGAFIAIMGLGMIGLFAVGLPQSIYRVTPSHDTAGGTFVFGIITAILGMPCFGPFLGGISAWALTQPSWLVMAVFTAVGVGNALPYLILSANPALIKKVPKSGPGSELIKQVMGLLMLAAATFFVGAGLQGLIREHPGLGSAIHWWFIALFVATAGLWLILRTWAITQGTGKRFAAATVGVALAGAAIAWAWNQTPSADASPTPGHAEAGDGPWQPFTRESFDQARASGKVVVVDFTAEWCINCKVLEASVLKPEPVASQLSSAGVVTFKADLTSRKAPGWEMLQKTLGRQGIPLLAIWGPGTTGTTGDAKPWLSEFYTATQVMDAIQAARGS